MCVINTNGLYLEIAQLTAKLVDTYPEIARHMRKRKIYSKSVSIWKTIKISGGTTIQA